MDDELIAVSGGIQLGLLAVDVAAGQRAPRPALDGSDVKHFASLVLFMLERLSAFDKRRVLQHAQHLVDH